MLAGRKLLLADDSITIQKIVALTFAEEGLEVITVSDGAEAILKLEETSPDVVLADIFMPRVNGYQVCEHIKQTERLRHIPVMLMVGSFEPFDEVEARRVGADDILTKPFQSIRTLMDKVGALLGREPAADHSEETATSGPEVLPMEATTTEWQATQGTPAVVAQEADTKELPPPELEPPPEEPMTTEELEITTADTQPLSPEILDRAERLGSEAGRAVETVLEAEPMSTNLNNDVSDVRSKSFDDALLDLDQLEPVAFDVNDDVILDVDFDFPPVELPAVVAGHTAQTAVAVGSGVQSPAFSHVFSPSVSEAPAVAEIVDQARQADEPEFVTTPLVEEGFVSQPGTAEMITETAPQMSSQASGLSAPAGLITLEQLAPEVIEAIARRAVEQLSERVVQEIAWEVVPQLADLMIKRKLEEQENK